ncbi:MAG TPA: VOC family protein [Solirubrobacterales bacterium]|jgi:catechol 2,3-dioxygenase-like lactoylglutathione lyase family enzyme
MEIEFVTSVAVIAPDPARSRRLYVETLGLPLADDGGSGYFHSENVAGTRHFGIWPLSQAAKACFGQDEWPADVPTPQVSIEFEVADREALDAAAEELAAAGHNLLHGPREEPWGQIVARLLSPEGAIVGISFAPALH